MSLQIPDSFRELLLQFAIVFYKKMPEDVLAFSVNYFKQMKQNLPKDVKKGIVIQADELLIIKEKSPSAKSEGSDEEDDMPPIPADYRRKSVYTKGYNPDDEDDEEDSEFGKFPKTEETKNKLRAAISQNLLFRGLEAQQMNTVLDAMKEVPIRIGDEVIRQGDDGDFFYVIDRGIFDVYVQTADQAEVMIKTYENSGCFGELALMYNQPRSATVRARTNGLAFSLDRNAFQKIVIKSAHDRRKLHEELLSKVTLFQGLSQVERQNIADVLETFPFENNDRIIKEGDEANGMYFIESGSVRVSKIINGQEVIIKIIEAGEYFGELALLNKKPRAADCYAIGQTKLAFLSAEAFERLMGPCLELLERHAAQYSVRMSQVYDKETTL